MIKKWFFLAVVLGWMIQGNPAVVARDGQYLQTYDVPTELPKKDELRKQLFNLLRPTVMEKAGQPVLFYGSLKVFRNWALYAGAVLDKKGRRVGFAPMDNSDAAALWLRTVNGWVLVDYSLGHSDVFWPVWHDAYGAPRDLVGGTTPQ